MCAGHVGFTGRLVTRYLHAHRERSTFTFAVAARSDSRLARLRAELQLEDSVESLVVDVTNLDQVENAVRRARVVLNVVGPYWHWGTPVVQCVL